MAEGCHKVAKEHGITDGLVQCGLELSAIKGPGVKRVADGQTCKTIADALEILHSAPRLALEILTVKGPASDCLRRGESCPTVAKAYEILQEEALLALQLIAVGKALKREVLARKSPAPSVSTREKRVSR